MRKAEKKIDRAVQNMKHGEPTQDGIVTQKELKLQDRSVRIWLCGFHGEVVKNVARVAYIAIFIKETLSVVLIQVLFRRQKILENL